MIFKNLFRRLTRSLLTILGIAVGVAAVVSLGAMAQGIANNYGNAIGLSNDLLVTQANALDIAYSSLDEDLALRIQAIPDVNNVDAGIFTWSAFEDMPFFLIFGYEPDSIAVQHYRIVEGKPLTGAKQIIIGSRAADALHKAINDTLRINGIPYRIVGIYETGQGMEESGGVVTLEEAKELAQKEREVSLFQIGLRPGAHIDSVMQRIETLSDRLTVSKSSDYANGEQWTAMLKGFAWSIAAIAILVGGLGMMSAMVMSVMERTREIGTLRAVGWSRWRVMHMILGEAILLSLAGGILGLGIGVGLALLAGQIPGVGAFLAGTFTPGIFVQGLTTALLLGLVGGAYPAWSAANLRPVEALHYEAGGAGETPAWVSRIGSQSFRNLWRRRTRTLLAATGIGIGVATLVMLGGLIEGLVSQLNGLAGSGSAGDITVMQQDVADMSLSSLDERIAHQIQGMPQVETVSSFVLGIVSTEDLPMFIVGGIEPNSAAVSHYKLAEGRYIQRPDEMLMGKNAADIYKLRVGDTFALFDNRYRVVGIFETGVAYEDGSGIMALREAQRLMNRGRTVSFIFVNVKNPALAEQVRDAIERRYPEVRASLSSEFAQNSNDIQSTMAIVGAIRAIALLVGGIVVANTMIMSVYERTREIGTLRAVGWRSTRILRQILQESLYLCLLAAAFGTILGVTILTLISRIPGITQFLSPVWHVQTFIVAVGMALILGAVGGILPAWRASRLQPVEALRYE